MVLSIQVLLKIPFSYMGILKKIAGNPKTILDLGCGDGAIIEIIGEKHWDVTGVDIYEDSLDQARKTGMYKTLIKGDLLTVVKKLIKEKKTYDLVFCSQIIEHLTREEGEELLKIIEKLAKKRIYFGTPSGFLHSHEIYYHGNPHQHHKSGWHIEDFKKLGYVVRGNGFKPLWSEEGMVRTNNKIAVFCISLIAFLFNPIVYYFPSLASGLLAVKYVSNEDTD